MLDFGWYAMKYHQQERIVHFPPNQYIDISTTVSKEHSNDDLITLVASRRPEHTDHEAGRVDSARKSLLGHE